MRHNLVFDVKMFSLVENVFRCKNVKKLGHNDYFLNDYTNMTAMIAARHDRVSSKNNDNCAIKLTRIVIILLPFHCSALSPRRASSRSFIVCRFSLT